MSSISNLILDSLDELGQDDFDRFKSCLRTNLPEGFDPIPRSKLEKAKQLDVLEMMVDQYTEPDAGKITVHILKKVRQNKLASNLEKELEGLGCKAQEDGAVTVPAAKQSKDKGHPPERTVSTPAKLENANLPPALDTSPSHVDEYKMSSKPRGVCLIINNIKFDPPLRSRLGSEKDVENLEEVFKWLGFKVEVHRDQTTEQMKNILKTYGQKQHDGDCFVCCILSHGLKKGVCGTDGGIVSRDDIYSPFYGKSCPSLINKPKVFFIQACRGDKTHPTVQADGHIEENAEEARVEEDGLEINSPKIIQDEADFFVARSTVKGYYSLRNTEFGSWFIQSLCEQLKKLCPANKDINFILVKINEDVSKKVAEIKRSLLVGQMSTYKSTLRKSLVFRPV